MPKGGFNSEVSLASGVGADDPVEATGYSASRWFRWGLARVLEGVFDLNVTEAVNEPVVEEVGSLSRSKTLFTLFEAFLDRSLSTELVDALVDVLRESGIQDPNGVFNTSCPAELDCRLGCSSKLVCLCWSASHNSISHRMPFLCDALRGLSKARRLLMPFWRATFSNQLLLLIKVPGLFS
jgi:hypothetical protein